MTENTHKIFVTTGASNHAQNERAHYDLYVTPKSALQRFLDVYKLNKNVWEIAVGTGELAEVLKENGYKVYCTDINDYGYKGLNGQELYKLRVFILNYSLQKMADRLQCSAPLLCRIERGSLTLTPAMSMQVIELIKNKCSFNPENDTEENFIRNYLLESELRE